MKVRLVFVAILASLFLSTNVFADTSIKAEVDRYSLTLGQALTYTLSLSSSEKKVPVPEMPDFSGFDVLSSAQSTNISFVKGSVVTNMVYTFALLPVNMGKFKIAPCKIAIEGKAYATTEFEIEVTQPNPTAPEPSFQEPGLPKKETPPKYEGEQLTL